MSPTATREQDSTTEICEQDSVAIGSSPSDGRPVRRGRMVAVALLFSLLAAACQPASAAPATTYFRVCFRASAPAIGSSGSYTGDVILDVWYKGAPVALASFRPYNNGCYSDILDSGSYYRVRVYNKVAGFYWLGQSEWLYAYPGGSINFGTVYLRTIRAL